MLKVAANGFEFPCLSVGSGPLVLCLHGFPDYPGTFSAQLEALAAAGYQAVAPYLRGYHPAVLSPDESYQTVAAAQDALALIPALGHEHAVVFGHDWGAAIAGAAAAIEPQRVSALVTAAVPYGSALFGALATDPEQQRRSWYMFFFQTLLAETAVRHDDMAFIRRLWRDWSPNWEFTDADIQPVLDTLAQPGVLPAAIAYYRCAMDPAWQKPELADLAAKVGTSLTMPCLHFHGGTDGCIGAELTADMADNFAGAFELEILPHAGHFLHLEEPETVSERLLQFLRDHATP